MGHVTCIGGRVMYKRVLVGTLRERKPLEDTHTHRWEDIKMNINTLLTGWSFN